MRTLGRRALVRAATLSAASVLGIAAAWVGAAPAAAATITSASTAGAGTAIGAAMAAPAGCPSGALCVYSGLNFTGSHSYLFDCNRTWVSLGRNDINESWYNNGTTGKFARIWQNVDFTGNLFGARLRETRPGSRCRGVAGPRQCGCETDRARRRC